MNNKRSMDLNELLYDGVSRKFATYYLEHAMAEKNNSLYDQDYVEWAHEHGFLAESAYAYGLTDENLKDYLSDYDYYKVWPVNNWSRIWVNDKLTLKLMLSDSELTGFMPEYYYYFFDGMLKPLQDAYYHGGDTFDNFIKLLQDKKEFACKPCNGTASVGFVRLSYLDGDFYINGNKTDKEGIKKIVTENSNYVFTEYLRPSEQFAKYSSFIHTLRIVVINTNGDNPVIVGGYLRLPNKHSGEANYLVLDDSNKGKYNVFCEVDFETGKFGNAKLTYCDRVCATEVHPDTGEKIEGRIENYDKLKKLINYVSCKFSNLEYMGFDIGITDSGFKCMEINTHPGIKYMQIFEPFNKNPYMATYFQRKIDEINRMSSSEKQKRNNILR